MRNRRHTLWVLLLSVGCFGTDAPTSAAHEDRRVYAASYSHEVDSTETPYSGDDARPLTPAEQERGFTWRKSQLPAPNPLRCAPWAEQLVIKEALCSRELFVVECGEKDAGGTPTGQYRNNDCPACETLSRYRETKPEGC
jgi:hypothetical protein